MAKVWMDNLLGSEAHVMVFDIIRFSNQLINKTTKTYLHK